MKLLVITVIVMLIFESGFVEAVDQAINRRWRFAHLPKPFSCSFCSTFWLTLLYIVLTGNLTLTNIMVCLLLANCEEFLAGLLHIIKRYMEKILDLIDIK